MRLRFFVNLLLFTSAAFSQQPDNSTPPAKTARAIPQPLPSGAKVNFVRTWSPNQPTTDRTIAYRTTDIGATPESTDYFDGLGRLLQTVNRGVAPLSKKDFVTPVLYDAYGRVAFQYLPYISPSADGALKKNAFTEQKVCFDALLTTADNNKEDIYYGKTDFENSPLNRVVKVMSPGNNWAGSGRGISKRYLVNAAGDEVRRWNITTIITGNVPFSNVVSLGIYPAEELQKNITIDELGKQTVEYLDKDGQMILKKIQIAPAPGPNHTGWLCTYYVYDTQGNLRFVIPPKAVEMLPSAGWTISPALSKSLCFRYEYDSRNRMIIKKIPGADSIEMVYDQRDRLVLLRDGNLRAVGGKWLATLYDNLNRPIMTGIYASTNTHGQLIIAQSTSPGTNSIQPAHLDPLTYTFYDNYTYPGAKAAQSSYFTKPQPGTNPYPEAITVNAQAKGLVTGTKVRVLETSQFLMTTQYYDPKGRLIQTISDNHNNGVDITTNLYDFSGKLLSTYQYLNNPSAGTAGVIRLLTNRTYDHAGRLIKVTKQLNDNAAFRRDIATNYYDALGQLQRKEFRRASGNIVESMTYTYNIRGWLKGINRNYVKGAETRYFGQELHYDAGFSNREYTGNIAGTTWRGTKISTPNAYGYLYDAAGRLLRANFTQSTSTNTWGKTLHNYDSWMGDGTNYTTAYDANGNIRRMQQWGAKGTSTNSKIDDLTYTIYDSTGLTASNKLYKVVDAVNDPKSTLGDFTDQQPAAAFDYAYDRNGNLTRDENKKISAIRYNHLNLPKSITLTSKGSISYMYDANGRKLAKIVTDNTVTPARITRTDYLGPAVFGNNILQLITHEEGRIRPLASGGFTYDYFLKDHLGNVRMVLAEDNPSKQAYVASMELKQAVVENSLFSNIDDSRSNKPPGYPDDPQSSTNTAVARLNGNDPRRRIGPSLVLKVQTGDTINLGARAFYKSAAIGKQQNTSVTAADMATALLSAFGKTTILAPGAHGSGGGPQSPPFGNDFVSNSWQRLRDKEPQSPPNTNRPKAYLNFVLFDEQFKLVEGSSGVRQVAASPDQLQTLAVNNLVMKQSGFLYVYTSNEAPQDIFFDNIILVLAGTPVLEETHYYPFGLVMEGLSEKVLYNPVNKEQKFQGQPFDDDLGLNWYGFKFRNHDPQIGRFIQADPLSDKYVYNSTYAFSENHVTAHVELEGLEKWSIKNGIGASINYYGPYANQNAAQLHFNDNKTTSGSMLNLTAGFVQNNRISTNRVEALERGSLDDVKGVVLHRTASSSTESTLRAFENGRDGINYGTHFLVGKKGEILQTASLDAYTLHVGKTRSNIYPTNATSIGIEVVGNYDFKAEKWEPLTDEQIKSTSFLTNSLKTTYKLTNAQVYNHEDISYKTSGEGNVVRSAISQYLVPPPLNTSNAKNPWWMQYLTK